jgi:hypothetical protein
MAGILLAFTFLTARAVEVFLIFQHPGVLVVVSLSAGTAAAASGFFMP